MSHPVEKVCPACGKTNVLPFKRRNRVGYCGYKCAYAHRLVSGSNPRQLTGPRFISCQKCGDPLKPKGGKKYCSKACAVAGYVGFCHSQETIATIVAKWTPERRAAARIPTTVRLCRHCNNPFSVRQYGKGSDRRLCSSECQRGLLCAANHMKRPEMRARMAEVARSRSAATRKKISVGTSRAWSEGKFAGVRTGKCHWYAYACTDGTISKVQGVWELAFVRWLDQHGLTFKSHRGRIAYVGEDGTAHTWLPDFWVEEWGQWIDVKADHFYRKEKFDCIRRSNPGLAVRVLFAGDLASLGIELYRSSGRYVRDLEELANRCRVGPKSNTQVVS